MELALVFLIVILGVGAIVYAGMRKPIAKPGPGSAGDGGSVGAPLRDHDMDGGADSRGGDGGGGGD